MQTWLDLPFADGVYTFKLGLGQIAELEKKCDAGLGRIYARTMAGRYGFDDDAILPAEADYRFSELIEIIRQGLIGGNHGMVDDAGVDVSPARADQLVRRYLTNAADERMSIKRVWAIAAATMGALVEGYSRPGEAGAGESPAA